MGNVIVWSGWIGGMAVGLYVLAQFWVTGRALGASSGYGNVCALASKQPYFRAGEYTDPTGWRLWFTLGIPLGGLLAAATSGDYSWQPTFAMDKYDEVFGTSLVAKGLVVGLGGVMMGYGARLAGGCTSGHSIVGLALLNPASLVASAGFFAGGIAAVQVFFRIFG